MESHIEDVGDIIDEIHLVFVEVNTSSIAIVIGSYTSAQQGTPCLPAPTSVDEFFIDISGLFMESNTTDMEDFFDDLSLLFDEVDSSTIIVRAHSDPQVHSLHDQSF